LPLSRLAIEVADMFRRPGLAWCNAGQVSLAQLKVMSASWSCRTAALGGDLERCDDCSHVRIAYKSCLVGKFSNGESAPRATLFQTA
jgi:hypothetical protein